MFVYIKYVCTVYIYCLYKDTYGIYFENIYIYLRVYIYIHINYIIFNNILKYIHARVYIYTYTQT